MTNTVHGVNTRPQHELRWQCSGGGRVEVQALCRQCSMPGDGQPSTLAKVPPWKSHTCYRLVDQPNRHQPRTYAEHMYPTQQTYLRTPCGPWQALRSVSLQAQPPKEPAKLVHACLLTCQQGGRGLKHHWATLAVASHIIPDSRPSKSQPLIPPTPSRSRSLTHAGNPDKELWALVPDR